MGLYYSVTGNLNFWVTGYVHLAAIYKIIKVEVWIESYPTTLCVYIHPYRYICFIKKYIIQFTHITKTCCSFFFLLCFFHTYLISQNDTAARSEVFSEFYLNTLFVFELCKFSRNFFYLVHKNQFWFGIAALCM